MRTCLALEGGRAPFGRRRCPRGGDPGWTPDAISNPIQTEPLGAGYRITGQQEKPPAMAVDCAPNLGTPGRTLPRTRNQLGRPERESVAARQRIADRSRSLSEIEVSSRSYPPHPLLLKALPAA